jgi:acyl-CoA reductase-like NAD-dependent aldehyde dehydrogenase
VPRTARASRRTAWGPGNAPCYFERSADLALAARDIVLGKTFDNGVLCSSPNSVVVDAPVAEEARRRFQAEGSYFLNAQEMDKLARRSSRRSGSPTPRSWASRRG